MVWYSIAGTVPAFNWPAAGFLRLLVRHLLLQLPAEPALWPGLGNLGRATGSYYEFALTGKLSSPNGAGPTPHASDCCRPNAHPDGQIRASHHMPVIKIHRRVHVRVRTYADRSGVGPLY